MPTAASELATVKGRDRRVGRLGRPNPVDPRDPSRGYAEQLVDGGAQSSFRASHVDQPEAWIGPEPIGEAIAERLSVEQGLLMSGRQGVGVPYGIEGAATDTWAGYTQQPQDFAGGVQMGATTRFINDTDSDPAFPSTTVPSILDPLAFSNPWSSIS
jgi:hypothetical protein